MRKLREADRLLEESDVAEICRHLEISVPTYQRLWPRLRRRSTDPMIVTLVMLRREGQ